MKTKQEIIIISDLWGKKKSKWLNYFEQVLARNYKIKFYDSCELGEINSNENDQENIHKAFVDSGIEKATEKLLQLESKPKIYIGCSVGGVIAWNAGLLGLPIERLITISSTRLRKEKEKPKCPLRMYFGEADEYKPNSDWIESIGVNSSKILEGNHGIYKEVSTLNQIFRELNEMEWLDLD